MAQPVLISDHVARCLRLLVQAEEALQNVGEKTSVSVLISLRDQHTRFRLWSGNIGAHKKGMSSLDYRVRDSSKIRNQVIRLLGDLAEQVQDVITIASGQRLPWDQLPDDESEPEPERLQEGENVEEEKATHGLASTELEQISMDIVEVVDCLFRLNVAIRNPAPHDRFVKYKFTDTSYFEPFDIQHVHSKFASISPKLEERLGKAISRRRQYFKYRKAHHEKLQQNLDDDGKPWNDEPAQSTIASSIPSHLKEQSEGGPSRTVLLEEDRSDAGLSETSYATSAAAAEVLRIPPMPEAAQKGPFECPFCFMMIVVTTKTSWKKHVYGDLRPYICLEPDCVTADREFSRRHEWMEHTRQVHWKAYICPFNCHATFASPADCKAHLKAKHPEAVDEDSRDALVKLAARDLDIEKGVPCPLCHEDLKSEKKYQRHVGHHQKQLALFALPVLDSKDDDDDDGNAKNSDADSRSTSVTSSAADLDDVASTPAPLPDELSEPSRAAPIQDRTEDLAIENPPGVSEGPRLAEHVISRLEEYYQRDRHPSIAAMEFLAVNLGIETDDVPHWFRNRREKEVMAYGHQGLKVDDQALESKGGAQRVLVEQPNNVVLAEEESRRLRNRTRSADAYRAGSRQTKHTPISQRRASMTLGQDAFEYLTPGDLVRYDLMAHDSNTDEYHRPRVRSNSNPRIAYEEERQSRATSQLPRSPNKPDNNVAGPSYEAPSSWTNESQPEKESPDSPVVLPEATVIGDPAVPHAPASDRGRSSHTAAFDENSSAGHIVRRRHASSAFNPNDLSGLRALRAQLAGQEDEQTLREKVPNDVEPSFKQPGQLGAEMTATLSTEESALSSPPQQIEILSSPPEIDEKKPIKGILKPPKAQFPEELNPIREGVAPHKDDQKKAAVPTGARWTKINRRLVNPEALTIGKERFEVRDDFVIVLRVLSKEEIEAYIVATAQLREMRLDELTRQEPKG
ncbi:hypothetical protein GQ53DRAFT_736224 [Thozetella sp. PMI_491]|nr:hypothetical protein GQ53DRAFT_736224 [Thozetella sp. PMI_491]